MAARKIPPSVAVDTGALLALASSRDQYHERALRTLAALQKAGTRMVGHVLVLGELHGHLLRRLDAASARRILGGLTKDPSFQWLDVDVPLIDRATSAWMDRFSDQRVSLTDALTFELMRESKLTHAFAYDQDFETAGFALLA